MAMNSEMKIIPLRSPVEVEGASGGEGLRGEILAGEMGMLRNFEANDGEFHGENNCWMMTKLVDN